jgi:hypothetical protein
MTGDTVARYQEEAVRAQDSSPRSDLNLRSRWGLDTRHSVVKRAGDREVRVVERVQDVNMPNPDRHPLK